MVVGWAVARVVVGWAVCWVAVQGVGFLVEWAAVDSVRAVAVEAEGAVGSVVPDQRVACLARAVAGRGWAARAVVARAVVVSVAARAAAGWAGVVWARETWAVETGWAAAATAVAVTARPRVCTKTGRSWCRRALHHRSGSPVQYCSRKSRADQGRR